MQDLRGGRPNPLWVFSPPVLRDRLWGAGSTRPTCRRARAIRGLCVTSALVAEHICQGTYFACFIGAPRRGAPCGRVRSNEFRLGSTQRAARRETKSNAAVDEFCRRASTSPATCTVQDASPPFRVRLEVCIFRASRIASETGLHGATALHSASLGRAVRV